jgi:copper transport protein
MLNVVDANTLCPSRCDDRIQVVWRVISADGHPVAGAFAFTVSGVSGVQPGASSIASSPVPTPIPDPVGASLFPTPESRDDSIPVITAALRGIGLGALMGGIGLLLFAGAGGEREASIAWRWSFRLILVAALVLVAHLTAWVSRLSPDDMSGIAIDSVAGSRVGQVEIIRTTLAILALLAIAVARRRTLTIVVGVACLAVSGLSGHPAAIASAWTVPAKVAHLLAGSIWLGGLLWLLTVAIDDKERFETEARRVSAAALLSVVVVFSTGIIQAFFFLNSPSELLTTDYGLLLSAKIAGVLILVGFGAHNRFSLVPSFAHESTPKRLKRSVGAEVCLVAALILIGGFLAYAPTPPKHQPNAMERGN